MICLCFGPTLVPGVSTSSTRLQSADLYLASSFFSCEQCSWLQITFALVNSEDPNQTGDTKDNVDSQTASEASSDDIDNPDLNDRTKQIKSLHLESQA